VNKNAVGVERDERKPENTADVITTPENAQ
jgi:hypothetical protein